MDFKSLTLPVVRKKGISLLWVYTHNVHTAIVVTWVVWWMLFYRKALKSPEEALDYLSTCMTLAVTEASLCHLRASNSPL